MESEEGILSWIAEDSCGTGERWLFPGPSHAQPIRASPLVKKWGSEVAARVDESWFGYLDAPVRRIAAPDTPVPFAPILEKFYVPSVEKILAVAQELVSSY